MATKTPVIFPKDKTLANGTHQKPIFKEVSFDHIKIDPRLQMRVKMDQAHIEQMAEVLLSGKELGGPKGRIYFDGNVNWLADGSHRVEAYRKANAQNKEIKLRMEFEIIRGGWREAFIYALSANATHGLTRSSDDKRRAVSCALEDEEISKLSDRSIADMCGVSHTMVTKFRKEVTVNRLQSASSSEYTNESRIGKDGRSYQAPKPSAPEPKKADEEDDGDDIPFDDPPTPEDVKSTTESELPPTPKAQTKSDESDKVADPLAAASEAFCGWVNKFNRRIDELIREAKEHEQDPLAFDYHWLTIIDNLSAVRKKMHVCRPRRQCPYCSATGKDQKDKRKTCGPCKGTGHVGETTYRSGCKAIGVKPEEAGEE